MGQHPFTSCRIKTATFLLLLMAMAGGLRAQIAALDTIVAPSDTSEPFRSWTAAPIVFYSPETEWAFGIGGAWFYRAGMKRKKPGRTVSSLDAFALYSVRNQFRVEFSSETYSDLDRWRSDVKVGYRRFPESYFGIGNETLLDNEEIVTRLHPFLEASFLREVLPHFFVGASSLVEHNDFVSILEGGLLDNPEIPGVAGGLNWGLGPQFLFDLRDNPRYTYRGFMAYASVVWHENSLGSVEDYLNTIVDLRYFIELPRTHVLGFQAYANLIVGDPPFYRMAMLGGPDMLRGFFEGRFRDEYYLATQMEYRFPIWWRFRGAVFAAVGDVARHLGDFDLSDFKYSGGLGLRLAIDPQERVYLRVDFAVGREGVRAFYFQFSEAF